MRFAGGVVDRGDAISGGGRHHEIFRTRHRRHVEMDSGAGQSVGAGDVVAVFELDASAHQAEADDVLFNPPHADVVAAGLRHPSLAPARQQRPHQEKRGPHPVGHGCQDLALGQPLGIDLELLRVQPANPHAHSLEEPDHGGDVLDAWHVLDPALFLRQQAGSQDRKDGILGTADGHTPDQPGSPLDQELRH